MIAIIFATTHRYHELGKQGSVGFADPYPYGYGYFWDDGNLQLSHLAKNIKVNLYSTLFSVFGNY